MTAGGPPAPPEISVVVPTVGRSPWLAACLGALRYQEGAAALEILVVDQSPEPLRLPPGLADRILRPGGNLGFAGGTNLGLAAARGDLLATVNDDALVASGWLSALAAALHANPRAAAAQGINLLAGTERLDSGVEVRTALPGKPQAEHEPAENELAENEQDEKTPTRVDGRGLGWNKWWQAIQLGHGEPYSGFNPARPGGAPATAEIFGVSATAALFRRSALQQVAPDGNVFDPRLGSYYEDADLAGRLRAAGFTALLVPVARVRHAGSSSGRTAAASRDRWRLIYGNRYLVAARLLGRAFWPRLPRMVLRDLIDVARVAANLGAGHPAGRRGRTALGTDIEGHRSQRLTGMAAGWYRALRHLPAFAHFGPPTVPPGEVARLSRQPD